MIDEEDWSGFVPAFTEAVRPALSPRGRYGRRLLAVAVVSLLALSISALMYGAFGGSGSAAGAAVGSAGDWTAVAGPTCDTSSTSFTAMGYSTAAVSADTTGWSTSARGGYTGAGCGGGFVSMPMSGQATAYDSLRTALWGFTLSAKDTTAACQVSVYVPDNAAVEFVGGAPAYYNVYGTRYAAGSKVTPLATFQVDQVSHLGTWVSGSTFRVTTGVVTVQLIDAGLDQATATMDAHDAAAQVRLTCQAA